jgi:hypothetical protein
MQFRFSSPTVMTCTFAFNCPLASGITPFPLSKVHSQKEADNESHVPASALGYVWRHNFLVPVSSFIKVISI